MSPKDLNAVARATTLPVGSAHAPPGQAVAVDLAFVLAFAFGAGMVAFFSPCCAAMLPAYISFALGRAESGEPNAPKADVSRRRREFGAVALWGGLMLAAFGLGRLAIEALSAFGGSTPSSPDDRGLSVAMAGAGIAIAMAGVYSSADRARMRKGVSFGAFATMGFLAIFIAVGLPVAFLARGVAPVLGYLAAAVGVMLVALGIFTLSGRHLVIPLRLFSPEARNVPGFFVFGVAYGLAALACTFPIFLVVVSLALVTGGFGAALLAFAAYALGKGAVMMLVTVLATASPAAVEGKIRKALPIFDKVMAAVLIAAGAFIAYYFGVLYVPA